MSSKPSFIVQQAHTYTEITELIISNSKQTHPHRYYSIIFKRKKQGLRDFSEATSLADVSVGAEIQANRPQCQSSL